MLVNVVDSVTVGTIGVLLGSDAVKSLDADVDTVDATVEASALEVTRADGCSMLLGRLPSLAAVCGVGSAVTSDNTDAMAVGGGYSDAEKEYSAQFGEVIQAGSLGA